MNPTKMLIERGEGTTGEVVHLEWGIEGPSRRKWESRDRVVPKDPTDLGAREVLVKPRRPESVERDWTRSELSKGPYFFTRLSPVRTHEVDEERPFGCLRQRKEDTHLFRSFYPVSEPFCPPRVGVVSRNRSRKNKFGDEPRSVTHTHSLNTFVYTRTYIHVSFFSDPVP